MGDKLGDYVHGRFSNYRFFGIKPRGKMDTSDYTRLEGIQDANTTLANYKRMQQSKQAFLTGLNQKQEESLTHLEGLLNAMRKGEAFANYGIKDPIEDILNEYLQKEFSDNLALERESLSVYRKDVGTNAQVTTTRFANLYKELKELEKLEQQMESGIKDGTIQGDLAIKWEKEVASALPAIKQHLKNFIEETWEFYSSKGKDRTWERYLQFGSRSYAQSKKYGSRTEALHEEIQSILNEYKGTIQLGQQNGKIFEAFVLTAKRVSIAQEQLKALKEADQLTEEAVKKVMTNFKRQVKIDFNKKRGWRGEDTLVTNFNPEKIASEAFNYDGDGVHMKVSSKPINSGEAKVDVEIFWQGDDTLRISAKNVNPLTKFGVQLEQGNVRNLLYHLQESPAFGNHLLNLAGTHRDSDMIANSLRRAYMTELQLTILYNALTGAGEGKGVNDTANVMVMNNKNTGKLELVSMNTLLNKLSQDLSNFQITIDGSLGSKEGNAMTLDFRLNNSWVPPNRHSKESARVRIARLLQSLNTIKFQVALMPRAELLA